MTTDAASRSIEFASPEQQESPLAFALFAWRRKWIVILMVMVGLGLGYLYFLREVPIYQSAGQLLLVRRTAKLPIEGLEVNAGYDATHEILIRSPFVVNIAVEKYGLKSLPSLSGYSNPTAVILEGLDVGPEIDDDKKNNVIKPGNVLRLTYTSANQNDCPKVIEAVVNAYRDFIGDTYQEVSDDAVALIVQAKEELDKQITEAQEQYRKFHFAAPLLGAGEARLNQIEQARSSKILENCVTQAKIDAIQNSLKRGGSREAISMMVGHVEQPNSGGPNPTSSVEFQLFPLMLEEQMLLEKYGPDHYKIQELRKKIDLTKQHLLGLTPPSDDRTSKLPPRDFFEIYLESLREQVRMNQQTIGEMNELFKTETEHAISMVADQRTDEMYRSSIDRKSRMFDNVLKKLEEISLIKDLNNIRVQMIHPPGQGIQIKPDMQRILASAGVLGMLLGLGFAFLIDRADRRFRSPDEIRHDLGLPVVGHIPVIPTSEKPKKGAVVTKGTDGRELSPVLRVLHHPRGRIAEAYRAVRTALYFSTRGTGHQVIQVTSPNPGDGKTTLTCNLAVSIAVSGKKVLLLDADFRRARCHRVFGVDNSVGVTDVLTGKAELEDVIHDSGIENLCLLPCGTKPHNPSELLTSPKFEELLGVLREKFDFVLLDTPPVLVVTDPLNVVPRVDGVIFVMRLTKNARAASRRALAALEEVGANVLGVVVNGIGGGRGYGEYGKYGYGKYSAGGYNAGYGYGYGYGGGDRYGYDGEYNYRYGYGYTDGDAKSYYEDSEESAKGAAINGKTKANNGKA